MDFVLALLRGLTSEYGIIGGAFLLLLAYIVSSQRKSMTLLTDLLKNNTNALLKMSHSIGKTLLDDDQAITMFTLFAETHAIKALEDVRQVLENNHITERPVEIKEFIAGQFDKNLMESCNNLKGFNTRAGDMSKIMNSVPREFILNKTYDIIFNLKAKNEDKLRDAKAFFQGCCTKAIKSLEEEIEKNK